MLHGHAAHRSGRKHVAWVTLDISVSIYCMSSHVGMRCQSCDALSRAILFGSSTNVMREAIKDCYRDVWLWDMTQACGGAPITRLTS